MLESVAAADFQGRIGQVYRLVQPGEAPVELLLVDVTELGAGGPGRRQPFSVEFAAPPGTALAQRIYRLEHDGATPLDLFLVPLGPQPSTGAMRYEAVFT